VRHKLYVWAQDNPQAGTFEPIYHRLADADDWHTDKLPHGHDLVAEAPTELVALILAATEDLADG
jgi:hypothetical protein